MFPDIKQLSPMILPAMIEHLNNQDFLSMKILKDVPEGVDNVVYFASTEDIAAFILDQFVSLVTGESPNESEATAD